VETKLVKDNDNRKDFIGDPDGIRTHDLDRDRVACLTATPRGLYCTSLSANTVKVYQQTIASVKHFLSVNN
jgi:hypothetical protein